MVVLRYVVDAKHDRHFGEKAFRIVCAGAECQPVNAWFDRFGSDEPRTPVRIRRAFEDDAVIALQ